MLLDLQSYSKKSKFSNNRLFEKYMLQLYELDDFYCHMLVHTKIFLRKISCHELLDLRSYGKISHF